MTYGPQTQRATIATVGTTSARVIESNQLRKGLSFFNASSVVIYIVTDDATATSSCFPLQPGLSAFIDFLNDPNSGVRYLTGWNAIAASGASNSLLIIEHI